MENHWNTTAIHAGDSENLSGSVVSPIYQTATWEFDQPEQVAAVAQAVLPPNFYNRCGSPNTRQAEATLAQLCGAEAAIVSASGMSAISMVLLGFLKAGDHIIAQQTLYPTTRAMLTTYLPQLNIDCTLVDQTDTEAFAAAIRPNTRLIFIETPVNPTMSLTDLGAIAALGKTHGIVTVADNTFATPFNQRPIAWGIDLSVHSATKYLAGHSDVGAGVVVGSAAHIEKLYGLHVMLGATLHPQEAWLLRRGLKTFGLRMAQHNRNGFVAAQFLADHPAVETVYYPGLASHPQYDLAQRQMKGGYSGMVGFELKGGRDAGRDLLTKLTMIKLAVSLGGVHSLITHIASTVGAPLSDEQLREAGISPGLVRLSVGVEDSADIIADLTQALLER